jgi:hypothetical protein
MPMVLIVIMVFAVYAYFFWPVDMMKAPGDTGMLISREAFESIPRFYCFLLRNFGGGLAGSVFSGLPGSLICFVSSISRFLLTYFVYGGILRGFLLPVVRSVFSFFYDGLLCGIFVPAVCSLWSFGAGAAYFVYDGLIRGFLIPIVCSFLKLGGDVAGIIYGGLIRGIFVPVVSSFVSFYADVASLVYNQLVWGFLIPAVASVVSFGASVASFMHGLLFHDWFIPFVLGLLVAPVVRFMFGTLDEW